ncbi:MAG TPA: GldG family protein [Clostridia bacterium]|nr:GldG family protein [Clostridia bacterium]
MENKNGAKSFFNGKNFKYGSNAVILVIAVIAIAILANILVGMTDVKLDLTKNKLFSLTDVTKNELKNLNQDVEIVGLFDDQKLTSDNEYKQVTDLLSLYSKNSHVKVSYVDPDKNPTIIKQLDPDNTMALQSTDFVVKSKTNGVEKKKKLQYYDLFAMQYDQSTYQQYTTGSNAEQGFTGAIKYVTSKVTPVVYFATGHNELALDSSFTNLKTYLENNNFQVKTLDLLTSSKIPDDAAMLIDAAPKNDITINESDLLASYIGNGGKVIFMFDYLANDPSFDNYNSLLSKYNVAVDYDRVSETDESRHLPNDPNTLVLDAAANEIIPQQLQTVLNNSRSITILKNAKEYIKTTALMSTADTAVGQMVSPSRGKDLKGPLDIAVAVENQGGTKPSKLLVIGNASFISDAAAKDATNANYYMNSAAFFVQSMNWMIGQKDEIVVPTKNYETNAINITQLQSKVMSGVLVIVLPLLILGVGLMVYLRRRHL